MDAGIGMNENTLGGESLGAVAGDGIAVIEVAMLSGVELDLSTVVQAGREAAIGMDRFDDGEVAIGDAERLIRRSELNAVTGGEFSVCLLIDADACEAARVVCCEFAVLFRHCEQVRRWINCDHRSVAAGFDTDAFAAARITNDIVEFVVAGP